MRLQATLVYPSIAGKGFNSLWQGMDGGWISHGLASISAAAKADGFDVNLLDLRSLTGWDHFRALVSARRPRLVGFTMTSADVGLVRQAAGIVKDLEASIVTVAGGPHVSMAPEEASRLEDLDHLVIGEGEELFPAMLRRIESGASPGPRLQHGSHPDLDLLPPVDRQLFLDAWAEQGFSFGSPEVPFLPELPPPFATIIAGRGCPFHCAFCKPGEDLVFGNKMRTRSPAHVVAELKDLTAKFTLTSFLFHDDCLLHDRDWLLDFIRLYRADNLNLVFFCQSRADLLVRNQDLVAQLRDIGLRGVFIGFESGSQRILDFLRKGTTVDDNLAAAKICKQQRLAIWANYMFGVPTETREEALATVDMIRTIDPDYFSPSFYTPQPGTELAAYVQENHLHLATADDGLRRNPDSPKIKGIDYSYLAWAVTRSMQRRPSNLLRRELRRFSLRLRRRLLNKPVQSAAQSF